MTPEDTTTSDIVVTGNKITISFSRRKSDGDYGSTEATVFLNNEVAVDATPQQVAEKATKMLNTSAAVVLEQLGIAYHYDTDAGVLREDLAPAAPARVAQALGGKPAGFAGPSTASTGGLRCKNPDEASPEPLPQWFIDEAAKLPITEYFDRRLSRDAAKNQPYFVEAARKGSGKGKNGDPKSFWPPRS